MLRRPRRCIENGPGQSLSAPLRFFVEVAVFVCCWPICGKCSMADPKSDDASSAPSKPTLIKEEIGDDIAINSVQLDTGRVVVTGQDALIQTALPEANGIYYKIGFGIAEWSRLEFESDHVISDKLGLAPMLLGCVLSRVTGVRPKFEILLGL